MTWDLIWSILLKVLILASVSFLTTLGGIILSKIIARHNNSRIYKYAKTLVEAAEQKFPNEGIKMGPQKQDYVMSQLAIKFPSIRDNQYLYNIVLQCVYELNRDIQTQKLREEFIAKYGEEPISVEVDENKSTDINKHVEEVSETNSDSTQNQVTHVMSKPKKRRPSSF